MSNIFGKLTSDGLEQTQDRLGGGYQPLDSDIYTGTIKTAYAGQAASGAMSVTLLVDLADGREYRETLYVTNKKGENFFISEAKKKVPLPGFTVVDDLCLIATGKPLAEQETEEKVVKVYDREAQAEVPKSVPMLMALLGQPVALGVIKQIVNKNEKQGDEYVPTAETREENYIDKVFHPELKLTVAEARNGQDKATFWDAWGERNKGQTRDKRTIKDGAASAPAGRTSTAKPGTPPAAGGQQPARQSLFGKK